MELLCQNPQEWRDENQDWGQKGENASASSEHGAMQPEPNQNLFFRHWNLH